MRVLLVEDDAALAQSVIRALRAESFAVDLATNGVQASDLGVSESYDVAILDIGLPRRDGLSVLAEWRAAGGTLPVLILTARTAWSDKVQGFKSGADDYLVKPFSVEELVMRLRALVRRAAGHAASILHCGPITFQAQTGLFLLNGAPVKLTGLEWRVLCQLMLRKETVVERLHLLERVYEGDVDIDSNSMEVIVGRLRRKIGARHIETVRGVGYRLTAGA